MPQTINCRQHAFITLALTDLCTVNTTSDAGSITLKNDGPGKVWVSFDPTVPAAANNVNCFVLKPGEIYSTAGVSRLTKLTLNADTASTLFNVVYSL
jgi:hypothetical protein